MHMGQTATIKRNHNHAFKNIILSDAITQQHHIIPLYAIQFNLARLQGNALTAVRESFQACHVEEQYA